MSLRFLPAVLLGAAVLPIACSSSNSQPSYLSRDQLLDPQTCAKCHQQHFTDWSGSMHAYASDDPVFLAMNKRGQRETNGALGDFCVKCHAPMAVHEGATTDGLNLASVPQKLKGITCFFCHDVDAVQGTHNNPLHLAGDVTMRGELSDPVANSAHPATYSALHDRDQATSATMCGSCHDIVTPQNAAIERTFAEWQQSVFSQLGGGDTCGQCHMAQSTNLVPIAQAPNVFARHYHAHTFAAVDQAMIASYPGIDVQKQAIQSFLGTTLASALCVVLDGNGSIRVLLDNIAAGHAFPSGSAQDRRLWAEVIATRNGQVVYQSGVVPDGTPVTSLTTDPDLWLLRDCMFDASGKSVDMFWQAASYESNTLPFQVTFDPTDPRFYQSHVVQYYPRDPTAQLPAMPDKVTLRMRLQPMGLEVLNDLVASGDLDPTIPAVMPTYDLGAQPVLTWTAATANAMYTEGPFQVSCVTTTNFNVAADKVPAVNHTKCQP